MSLAKVSAMGELQGEARLAAEQRPRVVIDRPLTDAGWAVQDKKDLNLLASEDVACREVVMKTSHGRADYVLYVATKAVGIIEAKPAGTTLSGVEWQSAMYANGLPPDVRLRVGEGWTRRPAPRPLGGAPRDAAFAGRRLGDRHADAVVEGWRMTERSKL